jgi:peptidoglycan hydrolase-like protein with peptidoglycan-binding domain
MVFRMNMPVLRYVESVPSSLLMKGLPVRRFQQFGEAVLGDVDFLTNDGVFGPRTHDLVIEVQNKLGLVEDGIVGEKTWRAIFEALDREEDGAKVYTTSQGVKVIDGRDVWTPVKKWYGVERRWCSDSKNQMRGVMLHQTGCWMPENTGTWRKINAHAGITHEGTLILMFPFNMLIWHGNNFSQNTIGVEIAGLYEGVNGKRRTVFPLDSPISELSAQQVKASFKLADLILEAFVENGDIWEYLVAHRQSSNQRLADPGEEIWRRIGLRWIQRYKLKDWSQEKIGTGKPIPRDWDELSPHGFWR